MGGSFCTFYHNTTALKNIVGLGYHLVKRVAWFTLSRNELMEMFVIFGVLVAGVLLALIVILERKAKKRRSDTLNHRWSYRSAKLLTNAE